MPHHVWTPKTSKLIPNVPGKDAGGHLSFMGSWPTLPHMRRVRRIGLCWQGNNWLSAVGKGKGIVALCSGPL